MKYKNTKTGVTFSSPCVVSGGDWVLIADELKTDEDIFGLGNYGS